MSARFSARSMWTSPRAVSTAATVPTPSPATTSSPTPTITRTSSSPQRNGAPIQLERARPLSSKASRTIRWPAGPAPTAPCCVIVFKQAGCQRHRNRGPHQGRPARRSERWIPPAIKISVLSDRTTTIRASVDEVAVLPHAQHRPGGHGDFSVSAPLLAHVHRQRHRAPRARRHFRRHVSAALQRGQSLAHGHHHLRRLRRG